MNNADKLAGVLAEQTDIVDRLCTSVELSAADIGGGEDQLDLLGLLGPANDKARQALASYRASKDVADEYAQNKGFNDIGPQAMIKFADPDVRDMYFHGEDAIEKATQTWHIRNMNWNCCLFITPKVSDISPENPDFEFRLQQLAKIPKSKPQVADTDNELAFALKLATINLTNPEDAAILQMIEQVIVHLQAAPNPWVKIEDIPEEWKDGRPVDLWLDNGDISWRFIEARYDKEIEDRWGDMDWDSSKATNSNPTHATLPPAPPQDEV